MGGREFQTCGGRGAVLDVHDKYRYITTILAAAGGTLQRALFRSHKQMPLNSRLLRSALATCLAASIRTQATSLAPNATGMHY